jgi:mutator protein MutT
VAAPVIEVAAGLVFHAGRLLITQRPAAGHLPNLWEFPGGKREAGETFEDCLRRELREELGIEIEPAGVLAEVTHAYPEKTVHLKFFKCRWTGGRPEALGCQALTWVSREELAKYSFPAADAQLLAGLRSTTGWWD